MARTKVTPRGRAGIVTCLGAVLALTLLLVPFSIDHSRAESVIEDAGHAPLFALATWWFIRLRRLRLRDRLGVRDCLLICGAVVIAGALTEIAQWFTGRDASWKDLGSDALGSVSALCWCLARFVDVSGRRKTALLAIVGIGACIYVAPLTVLAAAYERRQMQFPVLYVPEQRLDRYFIDELNAHGAIVDAGECDATHSLAGRRLRIDLGGAQYAGIALDEPKPDWRGFSALSLEVMNPQQQPISLVIRVHDRQHNDQFNDRFNRAFTLPAKTSDRLVISLSEIELAPTGRRMNLAEIAQIIIFRPEAGIPERFCLGRVGLQ